MYFKKDTFSLCAIGMPGSHIDVKGPARSLPGAKMSRGEKRTRNMVEQLAGSRANSPLDGENLDLPRTVASMRVLTAILEEVSGSQRAMYMEAGIFTAVAERVVAEVILDAPLRVGRGSWGIPNYP